MLHANHVLIACGTRPSHPGDVPFDGKKVIASDQFFQMEEIPRELIIVGGGVIDLEYASMLVAMGVEVTLIEQRPELLDFVDSEIVQALRYHMRRQGSLSFRPRAKKSLGLKWTCAGASSLNPKAANTFTPPA